MEWTANLQKKTFASYMLGRERYYLEYKEMHKIKHQTNEKTKPSKKQTLKLPIIR